jgi:(p)ppGpp synthase/HD superfamily hydrolase
MTPLVEKNLNKCGSLHEATNHMYGTEPYIVHLKAVVGVGIQFIHLIPNEDRDTVLTACAGHDLIEDARMTYNDIRGLFGGRVADIVYALTNEKGRTRAERANDKYYEGIRNTKYAPFVKLCDRIANVRHSKMQGSTMLGKYKSENDEFLLKVLPNGHKIGELVDELNNTF